MMKNILSFLFVLSCFTLSAQSEIHSRVFVHLDDQHTIKDLATLGLETDHGDYAPHKHFINDFSKSEIQQIQEAGFQYEIQIEDVQEWYFQQMAGETLETRNDDCNNQSPTYNYPTPENWGPGSMAGYFTYQEMLDELDAMAAAYPDLVSPRAEVDNITTHDGYPIYWLRMSDNAVNDEEEPEVLYTALHHAREPGGLSQMIFFMWYMLEGYGTNPEITYLLDETELYFMPCLNPDGYLYNELTNPMGGGLWRKNRRDNLDGTYGVDLNRNYGYEWGYDDTGSSPFPGSSTYRGPGPFSEPETAAVEAFCNEHEFQIALNYHTYGNLLIYPWGYLDTPTSEAAVFSGMAEAMTRENDFFAGTGTQTVGYTVNGTSDDWMYGEVISKPKIFSMTPEVGPGSFGFWPPQNYLEILIKSCVLQNLTTAHLVHNFGVVVDNSPTNLDASSGSIDYTLTRYGLADGALTVSLSALSSNILSILDGPQSYNLNLNESADNSFGFEVDPDTPFGESLEFLISIDNGEVILTDTLKKTYLAGDMETIFASDGTDLDTWTNLGEWGLTSTEYYSPPFSTTDSPGQAYENGVINTLTSPEIDLTDLETANLNFWGKWSIEEDYDYVLIEAVDVSTGTPTPLCGLYTNPGTGLFQPEDVPLYDGTQTDWVEEIISLDDFIGTTIYIEFTLTSDGGVNDDGFYFDDMEVFTVTPDTTINTQTLELEPQEALRLFPNPAGAFVWVDFAGGNAQEWRQLKLYDSLGRLVKEARFMGKRHRLSTADLPEGLYFLEVWQKAGRLDSGSLLIQK
ncbi:MAG: hypothetical protein GYB31_16945 [Bacteroidetes bacterium]|nr:hypothetical protein [Bacteroidota bacterium]